MYFNLRIDVPIIINYNLILIIIYTSCKMYGNIMEIGDTVFNRNEKISFFHVTPIIYMSHTLFLLIIRIYCENASVL